MNFTSALTLRPPQARLTVAGELDLSSARSVRRDVDDALADGTTDFVVDASAVTFVDAAGLRAFVRLRNATVARNGRLTFVAPSAAFVWVCGMAGLQRAFGLERAS